MQVFFFISVVGLQRTVSTPTVPWYCCQAGSCSCFCRPPIPPVMFICLVCVAKRVLVHIFCRPPIPPVMFICLVWKLWDVWVTSVGVWGRETYKERHESKIIIQNLTMIFKVEQDERSIKGNGQFFNNRKQIVTWISLYKRCIHWFIWRKHNLVN
jgi:hypothetical protein